MKSDAAIFAMIGAIGLFVAVIGASVGRLFNRVQALEDAARTKPAATERQEPHD